MQEAILILATVAQRFRLTPVSDRPLQLIPSVTLRPKGGIRLAGAAAPAGKLDQKGG